jgi:MinD-like ATPase involved in chromosome partitioning or flagellar assembly
VNPEISALKAVAALVEYLNEAGTVAAKTSFVLNNTFGREILKLRDVESALGTKVAIELPYDPFLYLKAVNEGVPIVLGAPRSAPAERLVRLSGTAFGADGVAVPAAAAEQRKGGRFSLRRR